MDSYRHYSAPIRAALSMLRNPYNRGPTIMVYLHLPARAPCKSTPLGEKRVSM